MNVIALDHAPVFEPFTSPEPTVREIITGHYSMFFSGGQSKEYAARYIDLLKIEPMPLPTNCPYDSWKPGKDIA